MNNFIKRLYRHIRKGITSTGMYILVKVLEIRLRLAYATVTLELVLTRSYYVPEIS